MSTKLPAQLEELALGASLDLLDESELAELQAALKEHPDEMQIAIDSYRDAAGDLALAAEPLAPPAALREKVLAGIDSLVETEDRAVIFEAPGIRALHPEALDWNRTPLPGISIKTLRDAAEDEYRTLLVKMEPGTTYPTHRHKQREELFLIEGDLSLEGKTMGPGDYCFAEPESVHQTIKTASGAVFLVMHSTSDEFLGWRGVIQKLSHIF